jgi:hypothetical protein
MNSTGSETLYAVEIPQVSRSIFQSIKAYASERGPIVQINPTQLLRTLGLRSTLSITGTQEDTR